MDLISQYLATKRKGMGRPAPWGGFRAGESCRVRGVDADGMR